MKEKASERRAPVNTGRQAPSSTVRRAPRCPGRPVLTIIIAVAVLAALTLLAGCRPAASSTAPRIDAAYFVDAAGFTVTSAAIGDITYLVIQATDPDKDMISVEFSAYHGGTWMYDQSVLMSPTTLTTEIYVGSFLVEGPAGSWVFEGFVLDAAGHTSSTASIGLTVY